MSKKFHIDILERVLKERQERNPSYSLRAFAKNLDLDGSVLSAILKDKRSIPAKKIEYILEKLELDEREAGLFLVSTKKSKLKYDKVERIDNENTKELDEETHYRILSSWEHYALLSLIETKDFKSDIDWISERLIIPKKKLSEVISDLIETNLINEINGEYIPTGNRMVTSQDVESEALKASNYTSMEIAQDRLDSVNMLLREFSSLTFSGDLKKINDAKNLIMEFQDKMEKLFEDGDKTDVFHCSLQFFPLTKVE